MRICVPTKRERGLTLVELLVVLVVIAVLAAMLLPTLEHSKDRDYARMNCMNNLRQVGLAFRIWAVDQNDKFPMEIPETNGGSMEFTTGPNLFRHFQVMSNELSTTKILVCLAEYDSSDMKIATNFGSPFANSNISYFLGVDAKQSNPRMFLAGDHNLTNGWAVQNGILALTSNRPAGWTTNIHNNRGNILLVDGSVQFTHGRDLRKLIENSGVATNRLQMPIPVP